METEFLLFLPNVISVHEKNWGNEGLYTTDNSAPLIHFPMRIRVQLSSLGGMVVYGGPAPEVPI